ncbi:hypothetical protein F2Q69_00015727 [Brassica cretica]|uniref:Uncharacterized protein n=1 Tax=Brassica cretica TaxID=69181 RepID=A0A8S9QUC0_BRACR|nr:hypothetical protein F2Q69_00015727 [Brassica cretica]
MEGSPYRKISFSRKKGAVSGPGVLCNGEPGASWRGPRGRCSARGLEKFNISVFSPNMIINQEEANVEIRNVIFDIKHWMTILLELPWFKDNLEESGDFGVFWSLIECRAAQTRQMFSYGWRLCLARGSCRGDEGLSIDETALVLIDSDAKTWAKHISRPIEAQKPHEVTKIPVDD